MMIKYVKKNYLYNFVIIVSQSNIALYHFLAKQPAVILRNLLSFSTFHQLFFILLNNQHLAFCKDWKQTLEMPWGRIASCHLELIWIERAYINRVDF